MAITDPKQLDRVQANNPILGSALLTRWSRAWVLWCWTDVPGDQPIPISTGDPGKGVVLVQDELIPVARCEPGASVLEVRQGPIPLVRLADLRWDDASGINSSRTDCEAAELHAPPNGPGVTESETSGAEADPLEELRSHLREVLVGDPRLVASLAGGNNVDADLGPNGPAGRIIAVECGAQGLFHLTAAIIDSQQSLSSFLARNRSTFRGSLNRRSSKVSGMAFPVCGEFKGLAIRGLPGVVPDGFFGPLCPVLQRVEGHRAFGPAPSRIE